MEKQERTTVGRNQVKTPAARQGLRIDRRARGSLTGHFRGTSPLARDEVVSLSPRLVGVRTDLLTVRQMSLVAVGGASRGDSGNRDRGCVRRSPHGRSVCQQRVQ